jgi:phenylacetate-CoA ligase
MVERGELGLAVDDLVERIRDRIREALLVSTEVALVDHASLPRSSYKSHLVDWSDAAPAGG